MNFRATLLVIVAITTAVSIFWFRVTKLGTEFIPTAGFGIWEVEARVVLPRPTTRVKLSIGIPPTQSGPKILQESFRSDGLAAGLIERLGSRSVYWTGRIKTKGKARLSYFAIIARGTSGIQIPKNLEPLAKLNSTFTKKEQEKVRELVRRSKREGKNPDGRIDKILSCVKDSKCPSGDFLGRFRVSSKKLHQALAAILNSAGHKSFVARGFLADHAHKNARFHYWVRTNLSSKAVDISATKDGGFNPEKMIFWGYVTKEPVQEKETEGYTLEYSLVPVEDFRSPSSIKEGEYQSVGWRLLSLRNLPLDIQASYRLMLLIPIGALMITLYRSILGFPTFGTFLPVLIALAFRETGLLWGSILITLVVSLGLIVRGLLSSMRLLLVPRLAANLSIVILLIILISRLSHNFGFTQGLTVTLFPIVIVTLLIERMSISWEESGAKNTFWLFISSILCAVLCYSAMMPPIVGYWVFTFPEILFLVIAATVICGRYTGYRLFELYRFRHFVSGEMK